VLTVSTREVAEHFNKRHDHLMRDIKTIQENMGSPQKWVDLFVENEYQNEQNNQWYKEYLLTRDGFSLLVMGFTGKEALAWKLKYIDAFNKMEAALKEQNTKLLPSTYKEALRQLLEQVEENERLLEENNKLAPKATYHDEVLKKPDLISTSIIAKDLGYKSASQLNEVMYKNKIIFREGGVWKPYAKFEWLISNCYADYESYNIHNANPLLKWTEKGRKWITENYKSWEENLHNE